MLSRSGINKPKQKNGGTWTWTVGHNGHHCSGTQELTQETWIGESFKAMLSSPSGERRGTIGTNLGCNILRSLSIDGDETFTVHSFTNRGLFQGYVTIKDY